MEGRLMFNFGMLICNSEHENLHFISAGGADYIYPNHNGCFFFKNDATWYNDNGI